MYVQQVEYEQANVHSSNETHQLDNKHFKCIFLLDFIIFLHEIWNEALSQRRKKKNQHQQLL